MSDDHHQHLRAHLVDLVKGGSAHPGFDDAIADLPGGLRGVMPENQPHTIWRLVEHIRIAQADILAYIDDSGPALNWPDDYWPRGNAPPNATAWTHSVEAFQEDSARMVKIAEDENVDLLAPLPHDKDKSIARQLMLAADHNAWHVAQIVMIRRLMGELHS